MFWAAAPNRALVVRLRAIADRLQTELDDVREKLQTARQTVIAIVAEIRDARGPHPTMVDRLTEIEARLDAVETPPVP